MKEAELQAKFQFNDMYISSLADQVREVFPHGPGGKPGSVMPKETAKNPQTVQELK